jgi:hypothetical protein
MLKKSMDEGMKRSRPTVIFSRDDGCLLADDVTDNRASRSNATFIVIYSPHHLPLGGSHDPVQGLFITPSFPSCCFFLDKCGSLIRNFTQYLFLLFFNSSAAIWSRWYVCLFPSAFLQSFWHARTNTHGRTDGTRAAGQTHIRDI